MKKTNLLLTIIASGMLLTACGKSSGSVTTNTGTEPTEPTTNPGTDTQPGTDTNPGTDTDPGVVKVDAVITFSGEREYIYDGNAHTPTFTVSEGVRYTAEYDKDDAFYSDEAPTEIGTYALVVKTEENETYKATTKWFVFSIVVNKPEAVITFSEETSFEYDGTGKTPTFTVSEGVEWVAEYDQNEAWYSDWGDAPTEVGTYALVVKTTENAEYRATTKWVVFSITPAQSAEKITPTITFPYESSGFHIIEGNLPEFTVSDDAPYTVVYGSDSLGRYDLEAPTQTGITYSITVTVTETEVFNSVSASMWFWYDAAPNAEKADPEITFNFEQDEHFTEGNLPTVTVSEGADYVVTYSSDSAAIEGASAPTVTGVTWSMVVEVKENDQYNAKRAWRWFWYDAAPNAEKAEPEITFNFEQGEHFVEGTLPTVTVSEGADYVVTYSSDSAAIEGASAPTVTGVTWSMVVEVRENDRYNAKRAWRWFWYDAN